MPRRSQAPGPAGRTTKAAILAKVRALCLGFPGTSERPSHGHFCYFIAGKRGFVNCLDNHHGDGRFALWCAAPPGAQAMLVDSAPDHYFVPPYVGGRGWVGVRLDRDATWAEIAMVVENAFIVRAPKKLLSAWRRG